MPWIFNDLQSYSVFGISPNLFLFHPPYFVFLYFLKFKKKYFSQFQFLKIVFSFYQAKMILACFVKFHNALKQ